MSQSLTSHKQDDQQVDSNGDEILVGLIASLNADENLTIRDAVELIQAAPNIVENIIHHVNSPDMGMRHVVDRLDHAVAILGLTKICVFLEKLIRLDPAHPIPPVAKFGHRQQAGDSVAQRN